MKNLVLFLCALFAMFSGYGAEEEEKKTIVVESHTSETKTLNQRQNYFLTSTNYSIAPKVNPVTGDYDENVHRSERPFDDVYLRFSR